MTPSLVIFDLDETLAESKQPITSEMAALITRLLEKTRVAVASGQKLELIQKHVADLLPPNTQREHLYLLPNCGAALYMYNETEWVPVYEELLYIESVQEITNAITDAIRATGLIDLETPSFGERIEHRGSSVTLSALGQQAPLTDKLAWDPERTKRPLLRDAIAERLPTYDVRTGGTTSFDVTLPGIDKAYGVRKLSEHLSIPIADMLYVGDALFPGGNDEVVKQTGIETRQTSGPIETARIIEELLAI